MSLNTIPADILLEIADHLSYPSQVLHLFLTSSRIADALTPALYSRVILHGPTQCVRTLDMLYVRPDRARHVRALEVSPDSPSSGRTIRWGRGALPSGYTVSSGVRRAARYFEVLRSFVWDGEELPPYDDMWFALRIFCPRLKFIATTLGSILPSPNSHLFDFNDLQGFSLTFKSGFYWQNDGISRDEPVPGYRRLWDMLIKRCPNLEHLAIDGHSPHAPVDAHGLVRGRWPKLRSLLIGDVVLDWHVGLNPALGRSFRTFLDAHRNLESLHLQSHAPSVAAPDVLAELDADALAKVSTFSGALAQAQVLPARASLKTLQVPDLLSLREGTPLSVSGSLAALPSLTSLTIAFRLEQGYDNGSTLRAVVAACPHLRHLDFTVACRPSFTIETFARYIRPLGQLRTFVLRIVPSPGEDSLCASGTKVVRLNPRLSSFELVFLTNTGGGGQGQGQGHGGALTTSLPSSSASLPVRAHGSFALALDTHGLPLSLHVVERHARFSSFFSSSFSFTSSPSTTAAPTTTPNTIAAAAAAVVSATTSSYASIFLPSSSWLWPWLSSSSSSLWSSWPWLWLWLWLWLVISLCLWPWLWLWIFFWPSGTTMSTTTTTTTTGTTATAIPNNNNNDNPYYPIIPNSVTTLATAATTAVAVAAAATTTWAIYIYIYTSSSSLLFSSLFYSSSSSSSSSTSSSSSSMLSLLSSSSSSLLSLLSSLSSSLSSSSSSSSLSSSSSNNICRRLMVVDLRPAGAPGTRRAPLFALVLERSPAGEEARLLMFCAILSVVVVWGCIAL
ncbi:hypothetical protein B0F90DRAFT_224866 [Multifurca ochricompacta]|uniref:F-box domain-containing protein n=1 Tax=Multifurca ochricompacta TaxID=376703 RepID=A0AAD4LWF6_9AGAM|nr:hypothetical protein B0F90DRAFT_224866 [Multifurca ochricompacta]